MGSTKQCTNNMAVAIRVEIYYGGFLSNLPTMNYEGGDVRMWSSVDPQKLSVASIHHQLQLIGFTSNFQLYYKFKHEDMLEGMSGFSNDADVVKLLKAIKGGETLQIYVDHAVDNHPIFYSLPEATKVIEAPSLEVTSFVHQDETEFNETEAPEPMIEAMPGPEEWPRTNFSEILPPFYKKQPGRQRKKRIRDEDEPQNSICVSRVGSTIHCGRCGGAGHNRKRCQGAVDPKRVVASVSEARRVAAYRKRVRERAAIPEVVPTTTRRTRRSKQGSASCASNATGMQGGGRGTTTQGRVRGATTQGRGRGDTAQGRGRCATTQGRGIGGTNPGRGRATGAPTNQGRGSVAATRAKEPVRRNLSVGATSERGNMRPNFSVGRGNGCSQSSTTTTQQSLHKGKGHEV